MCICSSTAYHNAYCTVNCLLANTRSPEAPAAADIHSSTRLATPSQRLCVHNRHMGPPAYTRLSRCSAIYARPPAAVSLAGSVLNTAITSVTNIFSVTVCGSLVSFFPAKPPFYYTKFLFSPYTRFRGRHNIIVYYWSHVENDD